MRRFQLIPSLRRRFSFQRGFVLVAGIIAIVVVSLLGVYIGQNVSFSAQRTKSIEFSNKAYYEALSEGESTLTSVLIDPTSNTGSTRNSNSSTGIVLTSSIPEIGRGNSPFNSGWNLLALGKPVQIVFTDQDFLREAAFDIRIPKRSQCNSSSSPFCSLLNTSYTGALVSWKLTLVHRSEYFSIEPNLNLLKTSSASRKVLFDEESVDTLPNINNGSIWNMEGTFPLSGSGGTLKKLIEDLATQRSTSNICEDRCVLRISLVQSVITKDARTLPGLEYRVRKNACSLSSSDPFDPTNDIIRSSCLFDASSLIPNSRIYIKSTSNTGMYSQTYELDRSQDAVSNSFEFTVIQ